MNLFSLDSHFHQIGTDSNALIHEYANMFHNTER